ncbi:hypothetical protein V6N11_001752 [Hibiscus sabdariffa]|uniref:AP2/ERF domain-containing protein n=1 Tax=Hibiscus sabdariffa TaxID=183260 RepID=A0ABR2QTC6_9ROSI
MVEGRKRRRKRIIQRKDSLKLRSGGDYDMEEKAARAYDLAALKKSSGFLRGASMFTSVQVCGIKAMHYKIGIKASTGDGGFVGNLEIGLKKFSDMKNKIKQLENLLSFQVLPIAMDRHNDTM